jgi:hypothetical protein
MPEKFVADLRRDRPLRGMPEESVLSHAAADVRDIDDRR